MPGPADPRHRPTADHLLRRTRLAHPGGVPQARPARPGAAGPGAPASPGASAGTAPPARRRGPAGKRPGGAAVRVLTWNLWGRFGPWLPRKEAIAATLADVGPDLCGLQEVWSAGGQNLAADLAERL